MRSVRPPEPTEVPDCTGRPAGRGTAVLEARAAGVRVFGPGLIIALAFFAASTLTLNDFGRTWDEGETYTAGFRNLEVVKALVSGQPRPRWTYHELPGYYFVLDSLRGAVARIASTRLGLLDEIQAFHFSHVTLSTVSIFLFYLLAQNVSGKPRVAVLSTMSLVFLPQFVAHSQNNPKDLPALFAYVLALHAFTRLREVSRLRDLLFAGLALGLALTTSITAVLLVPMLAAWHALAGRRLGWRPLVVVPVATVTAFLCWPWLWEAPGTNVIWAMRHISTFRSSLQVLYLGQLYNAWELPWHYSLVGFLAVTPVLFLLCAVGSFRVPRSVRDEAGSNPWSAAVLGWLWCAIPLAAEMRAPMRYDGVRHLLMIMPGFCLLVGLGWNRFLEWLEDAAVMRRFGRLRAMTAPGCAVVFFAWIGLDLVRIHPYYNAYLNEATNAWIRRDAADEFEVEYWGQSYKEGAEWINNHAERDADVYVGLAPECATPYLRRNTKPLDWDTLRQFKDQTRPAYFMVMSRKAMYTDPIQDILYHYAPVFTIRRQKGILLTVYSNRRPRWADETRRSGGASLTMRFSNAGSTATARTSHRRRPLSTRGCLDPRSGGRCADADCPLRRAASPLLSRSGPAGSHGGLQGSRSRSNPSERGRRRSSRATAPSTSRQGRHRRAVDPAPASP